jgi:2,4-dienoyl-CoA reductase-like NADH-dependent reductase (Old Yellow Enzyme family)
MSIVRTQQALFTPVRMGKLELWNRIVMAPPTGSAPRPVSSSANAPRLAARLTVGLILLVYGALRKFGDGAV